MAGGKTVLPSWARSAGTQAAPTHPSTAKAGDGTKLPSWSPAAVAGTNAGSGPVTKLPSWHPGKPGAAPLPADTPKKSGGGGILGTLGRVAHVVAQKVDLAAHDIKAMPGGLVDLAATDAKIAAEQARHPLASIEHPLLSDKQNPSHNTKAGKHGQQLAKGTVKGTKTSLEHPLRDPFQTVMTVAPIVSGGASLAARAGAAVDAAESGSLADVAKAAVSKPPVKPRVLRSGDAEVPLTPSHNPAFRAVQALHDRVVQKALDENPAGKVAGYGQHRVGGALDEQARVQQRMHEAPAVALDRAAKKLTSKASRAKGRVNQAALELTSVNTSPEDAAAYHLAQAAKGVEPARNRVVAKLYERVAKEGLLAKNADGDVIVNAAAHPKLAQADMRLAHVQGRGDEILARYGVRSPDALRAAVDAPAKYRAGATYEKPTPAKAGKSPALDQAVKLRDRLRQQFEHAYANQRGRLVEQPMDIAEAKNEHARLSLEHDAAVAKMADEMFGPVDRGEVAFRNLNNARARRQASGLDRAGRPSGASGAKARLLPTVKEERRAQVDRLIEEQIRKNPNHPTVARIAARLDRIAQLKQALEPEMFEKVDKKLLPTKQVYAARSGKLERIGGALSVAQERVQRLERMLHGYTDEKGVFHSGTVKDTGVVGGETARPGRGHVSYTSSEKRAPQTPAAASPGPVVGEAKAPITSHANQGVNISKGLVPEDITGGASRHFRQILRFQNTTDRRNAAIQTGSDIRRSDRDVLVKVPGQEHAKIPQAVEQALGKSKPTIDELAGLNAALDEYRKGLVPGLTDNFAADAQHPVGTTAVEAAQERGLDAPEGYKWVDRGALGDLARQPAGRGTGIGAKIGRKIDTVNSAVTAATVYFKVGHLGTRTFTNAATNIIQGSADPLSIGKSVSLWKSLSDEDKARALAASGQHSIQALPHEGTGAIAHVASKGAAWWARRIDSPFRFNAIAYEARKAGYDTPAKFHDLLNKLENPHGSNMDAAERSKVMGVANRANREAIAYDRLSDFEKRYITRAFWFYPWTAAATRFAVNTLLEHPYKAAALGQAGQIGRQDQAQRLGDLPSYEYGLIPFGGGKVADFSTFSPLATSGNVLEAAARPKQIGGFLNPVYSAANSLINGTTAYGTPSTSPIKDALSTLTSPTPEAQVLAALLNRNKPQNKKMFPASSAWAGTHDALLRMLLGPGVPRTINPAAAHSNAARERTGR